MCQNACSQGHTGTWLDCLQEENLIWWFAYWALASAGLATILALFGSRYWFFELFTHFRVAYLLLLLFAALTFVYTRNLPAAAAALLLCLPNLFYVGPYLKGLVLYQGVAGQSGSSVSLVSLNLLLTNHAHEAVLAYLKQKAPDVLVLSEMTPSWAQALAGLEQEYQWHEVHPQQGAFGLAVYSRFPLTDTRVTDLGAPDSINVHTIVDLPDRYLELYAVHLSAPTTAERAAWRNSQIASLSEQLSFGRIDLTEADSEQLENTSKPWQRMIIGDLNLTPFSSCFVKLLRRTSMFDARQRSGLHVTWPIGWVPVWIPIDHCIVGPDVSSVRVECGPDVGSDHYPLEVTISTRI